MALLEWPGGSWEATTGIVVAVIAAYVAVMWVALVFWTVRDIHQRTRDSMTQALSGLVVLFFFLPGHWLYLVLRPRLTLAERYERTLEAEAVLQELSDHSACPRCNKRVKDDFVHCPSCRARLKRACAVCQRPMDFAWAICPSCGTDPKERTAAAAAAPAATLPPRAPADRPAREEAAKPAAAPVAATAAARREGSVSAEDPPEARPQPFPGVAGPNAKQRRALAAAASKNNSNHANGNGNGHGNGVSAMSNGHLADAGDAFPRSQEFPNGPDVGH